ncbi:FAD-binding domain-containing protein [Sodiomyces alkalinus F11]|uniref:Delta(24)-sterol reductase n=1 Tax=Sodiomyces alkalinus (strain CBS 110278 / VKM F-3762 / F11) TaxID=1314773 RepID=A0A3N2PJ06_SODAK|nr:FAD-binding domain-containing protein [Sodiomyces alkalinus F11]ROT34519.1 FAD-binding domain-containing protein [Sodiomyces alkalinus F11]
MDQHSTAVYRIAEKVKIFYHKGIAFRIYHGSTNSTRLSNRKAGEVVDTSSLNRVLDIDPQRQVVLVEPNVPMDQLVAATTARGLIPEVVPEFPGITVGGAFAGAAAESSSFRYGVFERSVNWIELVLANGHVVRASADENENENPDLFRAAAGACGTLGIGTLFEIRLVKVDRFVEVEYHPVYSSAEGLALVDTLAADPSIDFLDGILFSASSGVIVTGRLAPSHSHPPTPDSDDDESAKTTHNKKKPAPIVRFTRAQDPWFWLHAHASVPHARHTHCDTCPFAPSRDPKEAIEHGRVINRVPVADYLFRYDRGAFWMAIYGQPPWFAGPLTRFLFDKAMHTRTMYKAMHHSGRSQSFIVQDLAVPRQNAQEFLEWSHKKLWIYPLWLCPIKTPDGARAPINFAKLPPLPSDDDDSSSPPASSGPDASSPPPNRQHCRRRRRRRRRYRRATCG